MEIYDHVVFDNQQLEGTHYVPTTQIKASLREIEVNERMYGGIQLVEIQKAMKNLAIGRGGGGGQEPIFPCP